MSLTEPGSPGGLWKAVLALRPKDRVWPADEEAVAFTLADQLHALAKTVATAGDDVMESGRQARHAWQDGSGAAMRGRVDSLGTQAYPELAGEVTGLGDRAAGYGRALQQSKNAISNEIAAADPLYALARSLPGAGPSVAAHIAESTADRIATYLAAAAGRLGSPAGAVPPPQLADVLDLPLTNAQGELPGGVNPALPTDLPTLQRLLDAARAAGLDPRRYAALLQQYYLVKAAGAAGIDLATWNPAAGVDGNQQTVLDVYRYYGRLFLDHPELQWAGMANLIGPSFAGGFMDLDGMKDLAGEVAATSIALPEGVPAELAAVAGAGELNWYEDKFLAMQKHIFLDQAPMHEAYLGGGLPAIDEMRRAGLIDDKATAAWAGIASGDQARIAQGSAALLDREQNQIVAHQYDEMYSHDGPVGRGVTYLMTAAGHPSIPGTLAPGEYRPLTVGDGTGPRLRTPLPDFDIADRTARWDYITHDTLPAYQRLLHDHPDELRRLVASPVEDRVQQERLANRWPQLAGQLGRWSIDAPAPR